MQTFLPYKSFKNSLQSLDWRRLGKQRVEAHQILNVLLGRTTTKGWVNHPITKMWKGYEPSLQLYFNLCVEEWINRCKIRTTNITPKTTHVQLGNAELDFKLINEKYIDGNINKNFLKKFPING